MKSLVDLSIDLVDSNEAILVLNSLPNLQILNGKSTKEEESEEEDNKNIYNIDKIEEMKNLESNSNYLSDNKNEGTNNINLTTIDSKKDNYSNGNKINDNINNNNNEQIKDISKMTFNECNDNMSNTDNKYETDNNKDLDSNNNNNKLLLSNNELINNNLNSSFINLLNNFNNQYNNNNYTEKYQSIINKLDESDEKYNNKLINTKINIIKDIYYDIIPDIIKNIPNLNDKLNKLTDELFSNINLLNNSFDLLENKIMQNNKEEKELNNNNNNSSDKINEYETKIKNLEISNKRLEKQIKEEKELSDKKINQLEAENKMMTDKLLKKVNNIISNNNTITDNVNSNNNNNQSSDQNSLLDSYPQKNNKNMHQNSFDNNKMNNNGLILDNNNNNHNVNNLRKHKGKNLSMSPQRVDNISSGKKSPVNNNMNTVNNNTTANNIITLKQLKEQINEIYKSKTKFDKKCIDNKEPKETMEQHMYTYLNNKYGLKSITLEWAKNIINGIKLYSKDDSTVLLFGKIMRNEQEENARYTIEKITESISELLLYSIKYNKPLKSAREIQKLFDEKKKSNLKEEEWKGIIYYIYGENEAKEIENKILNFINIKNTEEKEKEIMITSNYNFAYSYNNTNYNTSNKPSYMRSKGNSKTNAFNTSINSNLCTSRRNNNEIITGYASRHPKITREEKLMIKSQIKGNEIPYTNFLKIVLDFHIKLRDKQLKNFVDLFRKFDSDKNGLLDENEFENMMKDSRIFSELDIDSVVAKFLDILDPFDYQKISFSDCVSLFSVEMIINEKGEKVSLLERLCIGPNSGYNNNNNDNNTNALHKENEIIKEESI